VLGLESGEVSADLRIVPVALQEFAGPSPGKAEEGPVDELDRCGGTLDVEQNRGDSLQRAAALVGM
jgi:hypothetical protein